MQGIGSGEVVLTSVFVAFEGAFAYSAMLPSIMTIHTFVDSPEKITAIREGEILATAFCGIFAGVVAAIVRSWLPVGLTAIAAGFMIAIYEWALRDSPAWGG
jgi:hypothetical protein